MISSDMIRGIKYCRKLHPYYSVFRLTMALLCVMQGMSSWYSAEMAATGRSGRSGIRSMQNWKNCGAQRTSHMKYRCLSGWVHLSRKEIILMISFGYWMKICMRIRKNITENMRNAIAGNGIDKKKIVVHKSCCILPFGLYAAAFL